jgi:sugar lactone lactonase YvrE
MKHALQLSCASLVLASSSLAQVQPGDILVNVFGSGNAHIQPYHPDGTALVATSGGTGNYYEGAAVTPSGLFATSRRSPNGFNLYDPSTGLEVASHDTSTITFVPGDVDVFADGTLAIADQNGKVDLYTDAGVYLSSVTHAGITRAFGIYVAANDDLWVGDIPSVGIDAGNVFHFDRSGNYLGQFATSFEIGDLDVAPDGTIWCADRNHGFVYHFSATGTVLSSFLTAVATPNFDGLARAADGTLYVSSGGSTQVFHYNAAGTLLGQFAMQGPSGTVLFMRIVDHVGSNPVVYCTAGTTTNGCNASITANASPSLSLATACNITVAGVEGQRAGILFYGIDNTGFTPGPWATGSTSLLCVKHPTQRTPIQNSGGTFGACNGSLALDWNAFQTAHPSALGNPWSVGAKVYAQAWFRDPLAAKSTNLSNAVELTYLP